MSSGLGGEKKQMLTSLNTQYCALKVQFYLPSFGALGLCTHSHIYMLVISDETLALLPEFHFCQNRKRDSLFKQEWISIDSST